MRRLLLVIVLLAPLALAGCSLNSIMGNFVDKIPEAVIDASPREGHAPLTVQLNAHYSHDDRRIIEYHWCFGDPHDTAPATSSTATHTYRYPGIYLLELAVIDDKGQMDSEKIAIIVTNPPPVASFEVSNELPRAGDPVTFDASASYDSNGEITSYSWDFGDGNTGDGVKTSHVYTEDKYYVVTLTVTDNEGASGTAPWAVIAQGRTDNTSGCSDGTCGGGGDKPLAVISGLPSCQGATVGVPVVLDGSYSRAAEGTIIRYKWDFGDGTPTATGAIVSHTYQQTGRFKVTLTVNDDSGQQASAYGFIDVR